MNNKVLILLFAISFSNLKAQKSAGFTSNKHTPTIKLLSNVYAIFIPLGFIFIALFHYFNQSPIIIH